MNQFSLFARAKTRLVLDEPFYATILLQLELVETTKIGDRDLWLAATDGTHIYINPENFEKLSLGEAKGVLKHEVMHVALLHPFRTGSRNLRKWNHATDYAINPVIRDEGGELPKGALDGTAYKGQTAEQIYSSLPDDPSSGGNGQGKDQAGGSSGGDGNPLDDDIIPAPDQSSAAEAAAKQMIAKAAAVAKAQGKLPASLREQLDEIFRPSVDWREQLLAFLTEFVPNDYSWARPNRRFIAQDIYLPGISGVGAMRELGVIIDTSGSISASELKQYFGEITGAVDSVCPSKLVVAYCDAAVQHHDVFDSASAAQVAESRKRVGGGGTSMPAGLKWFKRNFPQVQAVLVLTDGYTDFAEESEFPFPVLWAITTDVKAPWGASIHVQVNG